MDRYERLSTLRGQRGKADVDDLAAERVSPRRPSGATWTTWPSSSC